MEGNVGFMKIYDLWFLMDLHVLGWPEHDLTSFPKCLGRPAVKWSGKPDADPKVPGSNPR